MSRTVLVVGGQSAAAQVYRRRLARSGTATVRVLVRRADPGLPGETVAQVADYFAPPSDVFSPGMAVVNFAGLTRGSEAEFRLANVAGPAALASAAREAGVTQFVQLSSFSVYGRAEDVGRQVSETPVSAYGRSKLAGDRALAALAQPGFRVTLLRVPALYGKGARNKLRLLAQVMKIAGVFPVPDRPRQRATLHFENLAASIEQVLSEALDGVQFACDPEYFTIETLADVVTRVRGRPVRLLRLPDATFSPLRILAPGVYGSLCTASRVQAGDCLAIDRQGVIGLREGLRDLLL